jgi:hypothetical protein
VVPAAAQPTPAGLRAGVPTWSLRRARYVVVGFVALTTLWTGATAILGPEWDSIANSLPILAWGQVALVMGWLYAARRNVDAFAAAAPRWSAGWTIGAWLIPVANYVLPALVIADVLRNSLPRRRGTGLALVAAWAVADAAKSLLGWDGRPNLGSWLREDMGELIGWVGLAVGLATTLISGASLIAVILLVSRAQLDRISGAGPARSGGSAPIAGLGSLT